MTLVKAKAVSLSWWWFPDVATQIYKVRHVDPPLPHGSLTPRYRSGPAPFKDLGPLIAVRYRARWLAARCRPSKQNALTQSQLPSLRFYRRPEHPRNDLW